MSIHTEAQAASPAARTFSLQISDDQRQMLEPVRRYARERLQPLLNEAATEARRQDARQTAAHLGLASAMMSERQGGLGIQPFELCLLLEDLASGPLGLAAELTVSLPALAVSREHEWLCRLLPQDAEALLAGRQALPLAVAAPPGQPTFALLPRHAAGLLLLAPDGGERWRLRWLDAAALHDLLAPASDKPSSEGLRLVRLPPAGEIHGTGFSATLPAGACQSILAWQGIWLGGLLAGAARAATAFAFSYAQTRVAFQRPIIQHQAVALKLADMAIATDALRLQVWDVATRLAQPARLPWGHFAAMARQVLNASLEIHRHAVQVCGGHGYVEGFPPARRFQEAQVLGLMLQELAQTSAYEEAVHAASTSDATAKAGL
ncbi:acyl-CoA/acyl-ACP dehydrogenase [Mitsuaria sp. WAJ17]|uniref:acyl-CoA dehydrogenase family protein n=1 Tax=Mitsuaria sp. WAJ17 TaxID=2761452 RepID=UPI001602FD8E|nr:acyl-CoA dehydrogenase family protein [Mitsuaria sp. WAJ17]MBB2484033.1 acyl-CoA/acyl-ACP dehydrogenase [Mitsuaria sp. WAJ17]